MIWGREISRSCTLQRTFISGEDSFGDFLWSRIAGKFDRTFERERGREGEHMRKRARVSERPRAHIFPFIRFMFSVCF